MRERERTPPSRCPIRRTATSCAPFDEMTLALVAAGHRRQSYRPVPLRPRGDPRIQTPRHVIGDLLRRRRDHQHEFSARGHPVGGARQLRCFKGRHGYRAAPTKNRQPAWLLNGARGGNRTRTALRPRDFKSLASTSFATRAGERIVTKYGGKREKRKSPGRPGLFLFGAGNETRTRDPNLGKVVLYQLSYSRVCLLLIGGWARNRTEVHGFAGRCITTLPPSLKTKNPGFRAEVSAFGAGNETRTRDPNLGKVVLYQLSYSRVTATDIVAMRAFVSSAFQPDSRIAKTGHAALRYLNIDQSVRAAAM